MKIRLDVPPSANRYWRRGRFSTFISKAAKVYRRHVAAACQEQGITPLDGPIKMTIFVALPILTRDLNNTPKVLADALQGHAYWNDNQIMQEHLYGCQAPRPKTKTAYCLVVIEPLDPASIEAVFAGMFPAESRKPHGSLRLQREGRNLRGTPGDPGAIDRGVAFRDPPGADE